VNVLLPFHACFVGVCSAYVGEAKHTRKLVGELVVGRIRSEIRSASLIGANGTTYSQARQVREARRVGRAADETKLSDRVVIQYSGRRAVRIEEAIEPYTDVRKEVGRDRPFHVDAILIAVHELRTSACQWVRQAVGTRDLVGVLLGPIKAEAGVVAQ